MQIDLHLQTNRHKFNVRWTNYINAYNDLIKELDEDKETFNYSLEEYELKESNIIKTLDRNLAAGIFDKQFDYLELM